MASPAYTDGFSKGQNGRTTTTPKSSLTGSRRCTRVNNVDEAVRREAGKKPMEEFFFKSALDADTSLALPAEPGARSSARLASGDRGLRVQQQVQLTLARKSKRSVSNGSVHFKRSGAKSFDVADGLRPHTMVNGFGCSLPSAKHMRRPSRRVEVSPPRTPDTAQRHFVFNGRHFGTSTLLPRSVSHKNCSLLDRSLSLGQRYALSEAPRWPRTNPSTPANSSFRFCSDGSFRRRGDESGWNESGWQQSEGMVFTPQLRDVTWTSKSQRLLRLNTYPPSGNSLEVDMGGRPGVELHQIQANNISTPRSEKPPEMTLERAVNLLSHQNEDTLINAAALIQSQCFKSADARKMVYFLRGIKKLLQLLHNDEEEVQRAAAAALRNVVYQNGDNKMEVRDHAGLPAILGVLKNSRDTVTRRHLAGLLWNLSSHDLLKESLTRNGLAVLTQSVLVPSSGISEGENPKDELLADAEVLYNATGCLRNLSSSGPDGRKAMRECENLIDSLVYYIRRTVSDYKADDKSTENCVCILHNLSYHIESELPDKYAASLLQSQERAATKPKEIGCFSQRSAKTKEQEQDGCRLLEEKANPRGIEWLWSSITIRMYLSLIARSVRHHTQEAAIGALQNITAGNGAVTKSIAYTIVRRENGLQHVRKMLLEGEREVKRTAVSLIKNLSRFFELHPDIVKQVLPEAVELLPNDDTGRDLPSDVTASLCHILFKLSQSDVHNVRAMLSQDALPKICNISKTDNGDGPSKAGVAACLLLHAMWRHSDLHETYKKSGFRKADFINARTTKAVNSI
ncbi:plakophilin-2 [Syngnathoides biaculeatus]|uniref:plakophilin-2 n=1 Tax=Syngnathoides biaculeatus TaxID=300417 RepID=UPI002ADD8168|nr:plakophilin-2 [Syngnathoides biaculeatus]